MPENRPVERQTKNDELKVPPILEQSFCGERDQHTCRVWIERNKTRHLLLPKGDHALDSSAGFDWGYGGRGPAKLALAILLSVLKDKELAKRVQHPFKMAQVAKWKEKWTISAREVQRVVADLLAGDKVCIPPRFSTGRVVATPGVLASVPKGELHSALSRHKAGDWGELDRADWQTNQDSIALEMRLFSVYIATSGEKFWIITEADRTVTTFLLPEEY